MTQSAFVSFETRWWFNPTLTKVTRRRHAQLGFWPDELESNYQSPMRWWDSLTQVTHPNRFSREHYKHNPQAMAHIFVCWQSICNRRNCHLFGIGIQHYMTYIFIYSYPYKYVHAHTRRVPKMLVIRLIWLNHVTNKHMIQQHSTKMWKPFKRWLNLVLNYRGLMHFTPCLQL